MKIRYFGHSCFLLEDSAGTSVVTDPYEGIGFEMPRGITADAVTVSHAHHDHNNVRAVGGDPLIFDTAGKFSVGNIEISAVKRFHDPFQGKKRGESLVFHFNIDGINVCHLGDLGEDFSPGTVETIRPADVLMIPVGGYYTIDAAEAKKYVEAVRPSVVIPMHYKVRGLNLPISPVEDFLERMEGVPVFRERGEIELNELQKNIKIIVLERF